MLLFGLKKIFITKENPGGYRPKAILTQQNLLRPLRRFPALVQVFFNIV